MTATTGSSLDETDAQIVAMLVEDGRLSTRAISRAIGMSPTAVSERLDRLHDRGIIVGYHAAVDLAAIGWDVEAIVGLETNQGKGLQELLDHVMTLPEVTAAHVVTGRWDVLLHVRTQTHQALHDLVVSQLSQIAGFIRSETMVCWEVRRRSAGAMFAGRAPQLPTAMPGVPHDARPVPNGKAAAAPEHAVRRASRDGHDPVARQSR